MLVWVMAQGPALTHHAPTHRQWCLAQLHACDPAAAGDVDEGQAHPPPCRHTVVSQVDGDVGGGVAVHGGEGDGQGADRQAAAEQLEGRRVQADGVGGAGGAGVNHHRSYVGCQAGGGGVSNATLSRHEQAGATSGQGGGLRAGVSGGSRRWRAGTTRSIRAPSQNTRIKTRT